MTRLVSPPKRLLNALDHGKVASRSRAWCRSSSAIYKSINRVSELVRILAGSVFDPGWWLGGSMSVEVYVSFCDNKPRLLSFYGKTLDSQIGSITLNS